MVVVLLSSLLGHHDPLQALHRLLPLARHHQPSPPLDHLLFRHHYRCQLRHLLFRVTLSVLSSVSFLDKAHGPRRRDLHRHAGCDWPGLPLQCHEHHVGLYIRSFTSMDCVTFEHADTDKGCLDHPHGIGLFVCLLHSDFLLVC